jgi:hypothetical protein
MTPAIASMAHKGGDPLTVVAIGNAFNGSLKFPRTVKPPSTSAKTAQVEDGLPIALSAVRAANGPAHFRLMVPHKVAFGSALATDNGARLFKPLRGKQELVLTFNLSDGIQYWQVEESNWTTEPLLANPSAHFTYKAREYEEFTSGGKIQEVAVHAGHSIYWVQNSILNTLSNATMIAIAEGLRPLH